MNVNDIVRLITGGYPMVVVSVVGTSNTYEWQDINGWPHKAPYDDLALMLSPTDSGWPAGPTGADGATGPAGPQGTPGIDGAIGPQGLIGLTGLQGLQGTPGDTGATGPQGPIGLTGNDGAQGTQGVQGIPGSDGAPGAQGPPGVSSKVGTLATGTVAARRFAVSFVCTNGTQWVETGRTAAMT